MALENTDILWISIFVTQGAWKAQDIAMPLDLLHHIGYRKKENNP